VNHVSAGGYGESGGGIYNDGTLTLTGCTVSGNQTGNGGPGCCGAGGGPPGGPGGYGGGIYNSRTATLVNTDVSGNLTGHGGSSFFGDDSIPGLGGGIISGGTLILSSCTISSNQIGQDPLIRSISGGGGIYHYGGAITISNSTVTNNTAFYGGGVHQTNGEMTISNSTITNNNGGVYGGGIYRENSPGGTVTLQSSIVAGNHALIYAPDIFGTVQSDGYNLFDDQRGATINSNPGAGPDFHGLPDLEPLADNGGPTLTHLPRINSPAIDKGKNFSGSSTDQRGVGFARVVDLPDLSYPNAADGTDIGAVEREATVVARNISTRARIETNDNVMIAGFVVGGTLPKKVLIRGLGPSLQDKNVAGFLADPVLELRGSSRALIFSNDDWQDDSAQAAQIQATGLAPTRSQESAIVLTLVPATYTAILRGKNNTSGVGLVEVYDVGSAESELVNLSTRGFVQGGDSVMIAGFTLGGSPNAARIAIRGIGPSLGQFGIKNALQDPTLELYDANGVLLVANDNWNDDGASAAQLTTNGLALSNTKESGIFTSLPAGQFTAILAGKNGGAGIGVVEIYNLK
jgi:hypothetical protein